MFSTSPTWRFSALTGGSLSSGGSFLNSWLLASKLCSCLTWAKRVARRVVLPRTNHQPPHTHICRVAPAARSTSGSLPRGHGDSRCAHWYQLGSTKLSEFKGTRDAMHFLGDPWSSSVPYLDCLCWFPLWKLRTDMDENWQGTKLKTVKTGMAANPIKHWNQFELQREGTVWSLMAD